MQGKRREFFFDRAFAPTDSQDDVYNEVGGPIVSNVLRGYNGTILAYGQTGTGKTYTMGILNRVSDEHAGLIPRSLSHIFGALWTCVPCRWHLVPLSLSLSVFLA